MFCKYCTHCPYSGICPCRGCKIDNKGDSFREDLEFNESSEEELEDERLDFTRTSKGEVERLLELLNETNPSIIKELTNYNIEKKSVNNLLFHMVDFTLKCEENFKPPYILNSIYDKYKKQNYPLIMSFVVRGVPMNVIESLLKRVIKFTIAYRKK